MLRGDGINLPAIYNPSDINAVPPNEINLWVEQLKVPAFGAITFDTFLCIAFDKKHDAMSICCGEMENLTISVHGWNKPARATSQQLAFRIRDCELTLRGDESGTNVKRSRIILKRRRKPDTWCAKCLLLLSLASRIYSPTADRPSTHGNVYASN